MLRISYNFADGTKSLLTLVVGLSDLKPVLFWLTVLEQSKLAERFAELPFSIVGKVKPSIDRYRSVIAAAGTARFTTCSRSVAPSTSNCRARHSVQRSSGSSGNMLGDGTQRSRSRSRARRSLGGLHADPGTSRARRVLGRESPRHGIGRRGRTFAAVGAGALPQSARRPRVSVCGAYSTEAAKDDTRGRRVEAAEPGVVHQEEGSWRVNGVSRCSSVRRTRI